jgi:xylulokinase
MSADIMGRPFVRPEVTEAGVLGAAILAGMGKGVFSTIEAGVEAMVRMGRIFEPDARQVSQYALWFERYRGLYPLMQEYLRDLASTQSGWFTE